MVTQQDVTDLRSLLVSGDRGGFYYKYYDLTGSEQALIQAQITTYSGAFGGAAVLGNQYVQEHGGANYNVTLDDFSVKIANTLLRAVEIQFEKNGITVTVY